MPERSAPAECANCGASLPRGAKACPECGADERTGWRDLDLYDGLDLPDKTFREVEDSDATRTRRSRSVNGIAWYWWCVGVAMVLLLALGALTLL